MDEVSLPAEPLTPEQRERVEAELCEHFAAGHLELDELERRLADADRASSAIELRSLVRDLQPLTASYSAPAAEPASHGWALALMGGSSRKGKWLPPRRLNAVAVMGGIELDFRDAALSPGVTQVTAVSIMGGIDIIVPPGLPVSVRGLGIMGAVDQVEHHTGERNPDMPQIVITALACMGAVEVKTRARSQTEQVISQKRGELNR